MPGLSRPINQTGPGNIYVRRKAKKWPASTVRKLVWLGSPSPLLPQIRAGKALELGAQLLVTQSK